MLDDIADRVMALVDELMAVGVPASQLVALLELVTAIAEGGPLDKLWKEALRTLDDFAAGKRRRAFWKPAELEF